MSEIENDEQHAAALAEIGALMDKDPAPDSPEGKRLLELAALVEAYEKKRWPI